MSSSGIIQLTSPYTFADTVQRLLRIFSEKGIKVFVTIDQQAEARAVGFAMPPTTLILFGNPKAGTPLMLASPQVGLDLPLKVLVCEPESGHTVVFITAASEIVKRHSLPAELLSNLAPAEQLIANALNQTIDASIQPANIQGLCLNYALHFMPSYRTSITIDCSRETIWHTLSDVVAWPKWLPTVRSVEALDAPTLAIGNRYTVVQPKLRRATWTITALAPLHHFAWRCRSPGLLMVANHVIQEQSAGRFAVTLEFSFSGLLGAPIGLLFRSMTETYLAQEAAALKRKLESEPERAAPSGAS